MDDIEKSVEENLIDFANTTYNLIEELLKLKEQTATFGEMEYPMSKSPIRKCKHGIYITKCSTCQKQEAFDARLADARSEVTFCLGEPTYHFLVGEKALYGHNELIIEEKLDNGTVYVGKNIVGDLIAEPWFRLARVDVEKSHW
jgi:hypothetical protein